MSYVRSKAGAGKGFVININTGTASTPTWTPVYEMAKLGMSRKNMTEEATNFNSTAKENVTTMPDGGDLKVSGNYIPTDVGQLALETAFASGALTQMQFIAPMSAGQTTSGDTWSGYGIITELNPDFESTKRSGTAFTFQTSNGLAKTAGS